MMLDYMTLHIDPGRLPAKAVLAMQARQDLIMCLSPEGEVRWTIPARANLCADTHQVTVRLCSTFTCNGSPARAMGEGTDNVFGSFDVIECFGGMIQFISKVLDCSIPDDPRLWNLTRLDVTGNYDLGSLVNVKQALNYLRHVEGGRYQVKTAAETVYWSKSSRLRAGKAYAKGPHMRYMIKKGKAQLSEARLEAVQRLLRLEVKLGAQFWRDHATPWYEWTGEQLQEVHNEYFAQFVGSVEIKEVEDVLENLQKVAPTPGYAKAAYKTWLLIQTHGVETAKELTGRAAWYKHKRLLKEVGISWADMHHRQVVPFRRKMIVLGEPVRSWDELVDEPEELEKPQKPKLALVQKDSVKVECIMCKIQYMGHDRGLNTCPKCGSYLYVRVVSGVNSSIEYCKES